MESSQWAKLLIIAVGITASTVADAFEAPQFYATVCASCHGERGEGGGAIAANLRVKPSNFGTATFWAKRDDARIRKAIKEGGAAVGVSPLMGPFGAALSDPELAEMVKYLRSFEPKEKQPPLKPTPTSPRQNPTPSRGDGGCDVDPSASETTADVVTDGVASLALETLQEGQEDSHPWTTAISTASGPILEVP